jgi:hypothetical protein
MKKKSFITLTNVLPCFQEPNELISRVPNDGEANHAAAKPLLSHKKGKNGAVVTSEAADYICPSATEVVHFEPARWQLNKTFFLDVHFARRCSLISYSVCPWHPSPVFWGYGQEPTLKWRT